MSSVFIKNMATLAEEESYTEEQMLEMRDAKCVFDATRCPVESVTVFMDKAEVNRSIRTRTRKGESEVILKKISPSIDRDSIRVEVKEGSANILEVIYHCKPLLDEEDDAEQQFTEMSEKQHSMQKKKEAMQMRKVRLTKQREVLDGFADNLLKPIPDEKAEKSDVDNKPYPVKIPNTLDGNLLEGMVGFFELYEKQATRLDENLHELGIELEFLDGELKKTEKEVKVAEQTRDEHMAREIIVLLEGSEESEVELCLSYVVTKAKWSPKYDIRVFSGDSRMKIIYYGLIQQATGEDWDDAKLTLSTAMPSVGGTVPSLGTQRLFFRPKYASPYATLRRTKTRKTNKKVGRAWSFHATKDEKAFLKQYGLLSDEESSAKEEEKDKLEKDEKEHTKEKERVNFVLDNPHIMEVKENMTSTTYEVVRRHCIPSDNTAHRVSIAMINLNPTFEYETVPKRSPYAYLRAKVKNTSPYALLAGPTSIYMDSNYCAKAEIKAVAPQEEFTCSLGADHGVQIAYKPLHKFRESSSVVGKNLTITNKQIIEIKNTHNEPIKILVMDQLPLATEEKIKVTLMEPVIKHPEKYDRSKQIRLNKYNNIEWDIEIPAGEFKELQMKYSVEHPSTEEVDASVLHLPHPHEI